MDNHSTTLLDSLRAMVVPEIHPSGNICNLLAEAKQQRGLFWAGLYLFREGQLVLGPFQGMAACTVIPMGRGVCGTAAATLEVQLVDDVRTLENYIACHEEARSEIVVPGLNEDGSLSFVLDVDSTKVAAFSQDDIDFYQGLARLLEPLAAKL